MSILTQPAEENNRKTRRSDFGKVAYGYYSPLISKLQQVSAIYRTPDGRMVEVTHVRGKSDWDGTGYSASVDIDSQTFRYVYYQRIPDLICVGQVIPDGESGSLCWEPDGGDYGPFTPEQEYERQTWERAS